MGTALLVTIIIYLDAKRVRSPIGRVANNWTAAVARSKNLKKGKVVTKDRSLALSN